MAEPTLVSWYPTARQILLALPLGFLILTWLFQAVRLVFDCPSARRREVLRRLSTPVPILVRGLGGDPRNGHVTDRSREGVRLSLPERVPTGAVLCLLPAGAPLTVPPVEVEVRSCRRQRKEHFAVGCHYVRVPPPEVLFYFG